MNKQDNYGAEHARGKIEDIQTLHIAHKVLIQGESLDNITGVSVDVLNSAKEIITEAQEGKYDLMERIRTLALEIRKRPDWVEGREEYRILLSTGGPRAHLTGLIDSQEPITVHMHWGYGSHNGELTLSRFEYDSLQWFAGMVIPT